MHTHTLVEEVNHNNQKLKQQQQQIKLFLILKRIYSINHL